jgi:hypothetical protein
MQLKSPLVTRQSVASHNVLLLSLRSLYLFVLVPISFCCHSPYLVFIGVVSV